MANPYVNKVQLGNGTTVMDITDTTAEASDVAAGKYFYAASGARTAGTASGGMVTTLWQNASPTSSFAAQTITLSDSVNNYDMVLVHYYHNATVESDRYDRLTVFLPTFSTASLDVVAHGYNRTGGRYITSISGTSMTFSAAGYNGSTTSSTNGYGTPIAVYGVKL